MYRLIGGLLKLNVGEIVSKKKVVFGTGTFAKNTISNLGDFDYFLDNDDEKCGKLFLGKPVYKPIYLLNEIKEELIIIIASSFKEQISNQLTEMGFLKNKDYFNIEDFVIIENETVKQVTIDHDLDVVKQLAGKILTNMNSKLDVIDKLYDIEFKVFSQWGEDGIIQYLINNIAIENKTFIEFGVQDYKESNTRFLLINNNWDGLVIEMNKDDVNKIKNDDIYFKHNLTVENSFITKENINSIFRNNNFTGDIGLLSIDIDGNDYWIWNEIDVINPRIVICEYNNILPKKTAYTIPYNSDFYRTDVHYSNLYYGANLKAFYELATIKGYEFVGTNSVGTNAFFVRKDIINGVKIAELSEYNIENKVRESRNLSGQMSFLSGEARLNEIKGMPLYNLDTQELDIFK